MKKEDLIPGIKVKTIDHIEVQDLISYNPDDDTVTTRLPDGNVVKSSEGALSKGFVAYAGR